MYVKEDLYFYLLTFLLYLIKIFKLFYCRLTHFKELLSPMGTNLTPSLHTSVALFPAVVLPIMEQLVSIRMVAFSRTISIVELQD